jgi:hypothetical protein
MAYKKEKGKVTKILKNYDAFILFESLEIHTIKRDTLGELVKFKLSKINFPEKSGFVRSKLSSFRSHFQTYPIP